MSFPSLKDSATQIRKSILLALKGTASAHRVTACLWVILTRPAPRVRTHIKNGIDYPNLDESTIRIMTSTIDMMRTINPTLCWPYKPPTRGLTDDELKGLGEESLHLREEASKVLHQISIKKKEVENESAAADFIAHLEQSKVWWEKIRSVHAKNYMKSEHFEMFEMHRFDVQKHIDMAEMAKDWKEHKKLVEEKKNLDKQMASIRKHAKDLEKVKMA